MRYQQNKQKQDYGKYTGFQELSFLAQGLDSGVEHTEIGILPLSL